MGRDQKQRDQQQPEADVIIGAISWRGSDSGDGSAKAADVVRLAPYLLARRGRAVAPPAHRA